VLYAVVSPGQSLGGLVDERVRWLGRFGPACAVVTGWRVGSLGRHAVRPGRGRSHAGLLRWILLPPAAVAAAGMLALRACGRDDLVGVLFAGLAGYWAGLDLAFGAWPLACGAKYSLTRPIPQPSPETDDVAGAQDPPHWTGL
jgi:hypothetical protein